MAISGIGQSLLSNLLKTQKGIHKSFHQLSSGKKKDDPTVNALANRLQAQTRGLSQANRNISHSQAHLSVAEGNIRSQMDQLQRAQDLALQAANGTMSDSDRSNLQNEFEQVMEDVDSLGQNASSTEIQSGPNEGQTTTVELGGTSASDLGLDTSGISTQEAAQEALAEIDAAMNSLSSEAARIGAQQNAAEFRSNANAVQEENLRAAQSNAEDIDYAEEVAEITRLQILQQAQVKTLQAKQKADKEKASLFVKNLKN